MHHVDSSAVEMVGYDEATTTLRIRFAGGATYAYHLVPRSVYDQLLAADSMGAFINTVIKPRFPAVRL